MKQNLLSSEPQRSVPYIDYYAEKDKKFNEQARPPSTSIFSGCLVYILGFVGRGADSRLNMNSMIQENGGRTTLAISSHVTHIVCQHLCHSKLTQLKSYIENRKVFVVKPEYIKDCINSGYLLSPDPYLSARPKEVPITQYFQKAEQEEA